MNAHAVSLVNVHALLTKTHSMLKATMTSVGQPMLKRMRFYAVRGKTFRERLFMSLVNLALVVQNL
jgi:hypothetical protein